MNKIFKVIWSKSKQCYIVVSEIAKNKTGKKKIVVASILATLALTSNVVTVHGAMPDGSRTDILGVAIGTGSASNSNQSVAIGYASSAQAPSSNPENLMWGLLVDKTLLLWGPVHLQNSILLYQLV